MLHPQHHIHYRKLPPIPIPSGLTRTESRYHSILPSLSLCKTPHEKRNKILPATSAFRSDIRLRAHTISNSTIPTTRSPPSAPERLDIYYIFFTNNENRSQSPSPLPKPPRRDQAPKHRPTSHQETHHYSFTNSIAIFQYLPYRRRAQKDTKEICKVVSENEPTEFVAERRVGSQGVGSV